MPPYQELYKNLIKYKKPKELSFIHLQNLCESSFTNKETFHIHENQDFQRESILFQFQGKSNWS